MKKIISLLFIPFILASAIPFLLTWCTNPNAEHDDVEEIDIENLPSRFDLRDVDGKNYVTPVKTQRYGDCWTFALAGAAETAYLYANGLGVPAGEINDKVDFSEKYIAWYMFHGITEDDVTAGKVRASQVGEGFDPSETEKERGELTAYFIGGPFVQTANLFGSGFGPVDESTEIDGECPYAYDDSWEGEWTLPLNAAYRSAPVSCLFRESRVLPVPAASDADGGYQFNADGINAIKSELYQGHGVTIALNAAHPGFNNKNRAVYYSGDDEPNHAVVIIGYDDDYPKENFTGEKSDGSVIQDSIPPENGALIAKNSWGLNTFDGDIDDGCFYLSYYDHSLLSAAGFVFDNSDPAEHSARSYDQYDLMMTQWYGVTDYEDETKTANVFDAEQDGNLCQIEYRTSCPETEVTYEIYKDTEDDDPSSGTLLEKGVHSHPYAGSHVVDLKGEYALKSGDRYAVVLTMTRKTDDSGKTVYTEVFPYSAGFFEGMTVTGIINKGESYLYTDGKWSDMSQMKADLCERAYQQCADDLKTNKALPKISLDKKTVTVDNYPIKALLSR